MKQLILIITLTLAALNISAQEVNLVPLDSAQYEIINDTLFERFEGFPKDWNISAEVWKYL